MKNTEKTKEQLLNENDQLKNKIAKLEKSELKSQIWLENLPVCTKIVDLDFNLQYMSASGIRELKIDDINAYYGKPYPLDFFPDSFKIPMASNLKKVKETGKTIIQEAPIVDVEGNELWYHSTIVPVNDDKGKLDYFMVVSLETTVRKKAQDEIQKTNSLLKSIINSPDNIIMFALDTNYNYLSFNEAHVKEMKLIYDADIEIGKHIIDYIPYDDDQTKVKINYKRVLKGERFTQIQQYGIDKDRSWYELIFNPIYDDLNRVTGFTVFVTNITERKQAEIVLQESENQLASIYEMAGDILFYLEVISDGAYKFKSVNKSFCIATGLSEDMIVGKLVSDVIPEPSLTNVLEKYKQAINENSVVRWEETSDYPVGQIIGDVSIAPVFDNDGRCTHLVGSVHEITNLKNTEKKLINEKQILANILEGTNAGTWDWNVQTGEVIFNERWAEIMGYTLKELEPVDVNTWNDNVHPDDLPHANALLNKHFKGELDYFDVIFRQPHKNGGWIWVNARGKVIERTEGGKPLRMSGTHLDITKRKIAEQELAKTNTNLEIIVRERTKDLEDKNKKLDDTLKVFVGRELKIRDLEKRLRAFEGG